MMDMIERVARAIALEARINPDTGWRIYRNYAVAAIEAASCPTPEMIEAGRACYNGMRTPTCEEVWAAMVAAIK